MLWISIVSYFTDSSKKSSCLCSNNISYTKESFDNQNVICMQDMNAAFKVVMNDVCENRVLYNYSTKLGYYDEQNNRKSNTVI